MSKANSGLAGATSGAAAGASLGPWGALAGGVLGGAAGYFGGQDDKSGDYYEQMLKAVQGIPLPVLKEQHPELYAELAKFNPEMDQAVVLGQSAMQGISLDPAYKAAQMQALAKLQGITGAEGKDSQFMADANRMQNDVNAQLQGNTGAIQQNMAARGMSGGATEMVSKQLAAQQAANRQAQMGMDINAQAQQRALAALAQQSQLGGQLSQQEFGQQSAKAQAQDAIARFNAANSQNVQSANVGARNLAQSQNLTNAQNLANKNVDKREAAKEWNTNTMQQQNFANQMQRVGMGNQIMGQQASNSARQAQNQDQFIGGVASGVAQYAAQQKLDDENAKRWNQLYSSPTIKREIA